MRRESSKKPGLPYIPDRETLNEINRKPREAAEAKRQGPKARSKKR